MDHRELHDCAERIYAGLIGPGAGPFNLTKDYEARALQTARERAALAGARLARLLNAVLR